MVAQLALRTQFSTSLVEFLTPSLHRASVLQSNRTLSFDERNRCLERSAKSSRHPAAFAVAAERSKPALVYTGQSSCCRCAAQHAAAPAVTTHSASGKLFQEIIGKPIPEPPPKLPSQISVRNVARLSLEETMTESSDVAADYSSDGSDDR